jgi:hypothetical protein
MHNRTIISLIACTLLACSICAGAIARFASPGICYLKRIQHDVYEKPAPKLVPPAGAPQLSLDIKPGLASLSWTPVSNAHVYRVGRANAAAGPYTVVAELPAPASNYSDPGVKIGIHYYYQVSAVHDGLSTFSKTLEYYIAPPPPTGGLEILTDVPVDITVDGVDKGTDNGDFTITGLSMGQHTFGVTAPGFHPQTFTLPISDSVDVKTVDLIAASIPLAVVAPSATEAVIPSSSPDALSTPDLNSRSTSKPENMAASSPNSPRTAREAVHSGVVAAEAGNYLSAVQYFQMAREITPDDPTIYFNIGLAESRIPGRELRAIGWLAAYLAAMPSAANASEVKNQIAVLDAKSQSNLIGLIKRVQDASAQLQGFHSDSIAALWTVAASESTTSQEPHSPAASDWLSRLDDDDQSHDCPLDTEPFLDLTAYFASLPASADPRQVLTAQIAAARRIVVAQNVVDAMLAERNSPSAVAGSSTRISSKSTSGSGGNATVIDINCGGAGVGPFIADTDFIGGATTSVTNTILTTGLTSPAPQAVYQHIRYGNFTYSFPGLTAGAVYTVRLHFAEQYWTSAGKRTFNVSINGTQVLTRFDIVKTAGGSYVATIQQFSATANRDGQIVIVFDSVVNYAQINGIEIRSMSGGSGG